MLRPLPSSVSVLALAILLGVCAPPIHGKQKEPLDRRHVELEGQPNFRDLGGYKTVDGKSVKWNLVYRSGELPRLTANDVERLKQVGIKTVVNFLTDAEMKARGKDRLPTGVREVAAPIESNDGLVQVASEARRTADFSKIPPELNPEFHRILVAAARKQYASLLREVANTDGPIVFHCSHGIHRTGTASAILLWALGVPWETIREDYLLSNRYRKTEVSKRLEQLRLLAAEKRGIDPKQVDMKNINSFYILQGNYIDATRDAILKDYGSINGYLTKGLGLTTGDMARLRARLLE